MARPALSVKTSDPLDALADKAVSSGKPDQLAAIRFASKIVPVRTEVSSAGYVIKIVAAVMTTSDVTGCGPLPCDVGLGCLVEFREATGTQCHGL